jgi:hypothetical protein
VQDAELSSPTSGDEVKNQARKRHTIISPNMNDIGAQSPSNEHIDRLAGILLTYNFYEKELGSSSLVRWSGTAVYALRANYEGNEGYVQGMSDLCAPVYVVMGSDEESTFWCFVEVMDRMVRIKIDPFGQIIISS